MHIKILWRLIIWLVVMLYLWLDMIVFEGPIHKLLKTDKEDPALENLEVVARVFDVPILLSQIDFSVDQKLWSTGRSRSQVPDSERTYLRQLILRDLVDFYIFKEKVRFNHDGFPVTEKQIDAAVETFSKRFDNHETMLKAVGGFGFQGEAELRARLAAKIQQDLYLEEQIKPGITQTEEALKKWYDDYKQHSSIPERVKAQHIFCAKLENTEAQALEKLTAAQQALVANTQSFQQLASSTSEDERSKNNAGQLGWLHKGRIQPDFAKQLFSSPLNTPTIITTKIGWHLILITDKKPAEVRSYESMKPEIKLALASFNRKKALLEYRINLRKQHANVIRINWELLENPWTTGRNKSFSTH